MVQVRGREIFRQQVYLAGILSPVLEGFRWQLSFVRCVLRPERDLVQQCGSSENLTHGAIRQRCLQHAASSRQSGQHGCLGNYLPPSREHSGNRRCSGPDSTGYCMQCLASGLSLGPPRLAVSAHVVLLESFLNTAAAGPRASGVTL